MDKPNVGIIYKLANGERICLDVSIEVKELLEQSDQQIRSQRRQDRRYLYFVGSVSDLENGHAQPQEDTADHVIRMDSYNRLYAAINKLSDVQRRRLVLHYFHNLTHRQIADMDGVNHTAVGQAIRRSISNLRRYLTN